MTVARKIVYNVVFNAVAKVLSTALALVGMAFVMRYLGINGYGEYSIMLTFFSFFGAIGDFGLYNIVTREISRKNADEEMILGNVFTLRLVISLAIFVLSPAIVYFLPYSESLKISILLSGSAFVLASSYMVFNGVFQKRLEMNRVALVELIGKVVQVGILIAASTYDWGFLAVASSLPLYMLFNFTLVIMMSRRYVAWKFRFDTGYWRAFLKESLPMGVAGLVTFLYFKFDSILLSVLQDTEAVGIYNGAYKIIENLVFFPAMIIGLVFPLFSRHIFEERTVFREYADKTFKVFFIMVVPLLIGTLFFAKDLVTLMGGEDFARSAGVLRILMFALAAMFFGQWSNAILLAGNLQRKMLKILVACAIVNVAANILIIPVYSYYGAATISVITEILVVAIGAFLLHKHLDYRPTLSRWWGIFASGAVMSLFFAVSAEHIHFLIAALIGTAIYFGFLVLLGSVKKEEFSGIFVKEAV